MNQIDLAKCKLILEVGLFVHFPLRGLNAVGSPTLSNDLSGNVTPQISASLNDRAALVSTEWPTLGSHSANYCLQKVKASQGCQAIAKTIGGLPTDI